MLEDPRLRHCRQTADAAVEDGFRQPDETEVATVPAALQSPHALVCERLQHNCGQSLLVTRDACTHAQSLHALIVALLEELGKTRRFAAANTIDE